MTGDSPRVKVFTATWPPFNVDIDPMDEVFAHGEGLMEQREGPQCQVTVRMMSTSPSEAFSRIKGGNDPILSEPSHLIRAYNSLSFSEEGRYRLILSGCRGFMVSSTPGAGTDHGCNSAEGVGEGLFETVRLSFFSVPPFIDFNVDDQESPGDVTMIGSFHLVPVAHYPSTLSSTATEVQTGRSEFGRDRHDDSLPTATSPPEGSTPDSITLLATRAARSSSLKMSFCLAFVSGALIGVVASFMLLRRRTIKGWRRTAFKKGQMHEKPQRRGEAPGSLSQQRSKGIPDDGNASDATSSDGGVMLNDLAPDSVGLPRSDEDWRAWFDTLYEDGRDRPTTTIQAPAVQSRPITDNGSQDPVVSAGIAPRTLP